MPKKNFHTHCKKFHLQIEAVQCPLCKSEKFIKISSLYSHMKMHIGAMPVVKSGDIQNLDSSNIDNTHEILERCKSAVQPISIIDGWLDGCGLAHRWCIGIFHRWCIPSKIALPSVLHRCSPERHRRSSAAPSDQRFLLVATSL